MTVLVPVSEISNANWTAVGRATTWDCLTSFDDDGTYAQTAIPGGVLVVGLAVGSATAPGTLHMVSVRAKASGGPSVQATQVLVELLETATVRGSLTCVLVWPQPYVWQTFTFGSFTVTAQSDLRLRLTASVLPANLRLRVTAAKLEYLDVLAQPRAARGSFAYAGVEAGSGVYAGVQRGASSPCV